MSKVKNVMLKNADGNLAALVSWDDLAPRRCPVEEFRTECYRVTINDVDVVILPFEFVVLWHSGPDAGKHEVFAPDVLRERFIAVELLDTDAHK